MNHIRYPADLAKTNVLGHVRLCLLNRPFDQTLPPTCVAEKTIAKYPSLLGVSGQVTDLPRQSTKPGMESGIM